MAASIETRVIPTSCDHGCGGRCTLRAYVSGGVITKIETADGPEPQLRACLRGRAYRQKVYAPDRLLFPMKRVGARGEGKFARITWDEALGTVASELKRVKETYGPAAIMFLGGTGSVGLLQGAPWGIEPVPTLLNLLGGCTLRAGWISHEACLYATMATYGTLATGNTRDDLVNSKLIILWGWNPAETIFDTNTTWYLARAREAGARIISVDPRCSDSTAAFAHQWIPIRPGTDTAMLVAMAYVMIIEELQDKKFLNTYTFGFDKFKGYVLGEEDGIPKTPAWASAITGVPASTIQQLARDYATIRPGALMDGWAAGREAYGEQFHRATMTLAAMTGNIGIHGGGASGRGLTTSGSTKELRRSAGSHIPPVEGMNKPENPLDRGVSRRNDALPLPGMNYSRVGVRFAKVFDAMLTGKSGGHFSDYKLVYVAGANPLNQDLNLNKGIEAFKKPEFIVVHEQFMTATAKFADILLPVNTVLERSDVCMPWASAERYYVYVNKVIDSLGESKSDFQICRELAARLGVSGFSDRTDEEWLRGFVKSWSDGPEYDDFKKRGSYRAPLAEPLVAFKPQIEDPANNPFPTPSGKIEIYSQVLASMNNPKVPPVPKYVESWEGVADALAKKYPLQLVTTHFRRRSHSQFDNIPWLREVQRQAIEINSADARARGIKDGDKVRVFNDRGNVIIVARVTERIMPGVVNIPQGAWYNPDKDGNDRGGCGNVLTKDEHSPGGGFCNNTSLVEVEKA